MLVSQYLCICPICIFYACIPVSLYLFYLCFLCLHPCSILGSVLSVFSILASQYTNTCICPLCVFYACITVSAFICPIYVFYTCIPVSLYLSYLCFLCLYPSILVSVLSMFSMLESQYPCISMITVSFTNYLRISPQGIRLENQFKATRRNSNQICNLSSFQISAAFVKSLKQHLCLQF